MSEYEAPGWPAEWLNAWLAALGVTILLPDVALRWTSGPRPYAVFVGDVDSLPERLAATLPTVEEIDSYVISLEDPTWKRSAPLRLFASLAESARRESDGTLAMWGTDIVSDASREPLTAVGRFNTPGPGTVRQLPQRLRRCREKLEEPCGNSVESSLRGTLGRVGGFGLGFDYRRISSPTWNSTQPMVDPVVECLAFFGLVFVPSRGRPSTSNTRGWSAGKESAFAWVAWQLPLRAAAIDAMLDRYWSGKSVGEVNYRSILYSGQGSDTTVGLGSRKVER